MITDLAVYTTLKCLGMDERMIKNAILNHGQGLVSYMSIQDFEEIRHHELSIEYKSVYRQNKYLGG